MSVKFEDSHRILIFTTASLMTDVKREALDDERQRRLQWRCRRGMRELDLVFSTYLSQRYLTADLAERIAFEHLIVCEDADIYAWLMGYSVPVDPAVRPIIARMRNLLESRPGSSD